MAAGWAFSIRFFNFLLLFGCSVSPLGVLSAPCLWGSLFFRFLVPYSARPWLDSSQCWDGLLWSRLQMHCTRLFVAQACPYRVAALRSRSPVALGADRGWAIFWSCTASNSGLAHVFGFSHKRIAQPCLDLRRSCLASPPMSFAWLRFRTGGLVGWQSVLFTRFYVCVACRHLFGADPLRRSNGGRTALSCIFQ